MGSVIRCRLVLGLMICTLHRLTCLLENPILFRLVSTMCRALYYLHSPDHGSCKTIGRNKWLYLQLLPVSIVVFVAYILCMNHRIGLADNVFSLSHMSRMLSDALKPSPYYLLHLLLQSRRRPIRASFVKKEELKHIDIALFSGEQSLEICKHVMNQQVHTP